MRRAPHDGQNPRRLQENATSFSCAQSAQAQISVGQNAAFEKSLELVFDKLRQARSGPRFDLSEEALKLFLYHLIERRFFRAPPLVMKSRRMSSQRRFKRSAHDARLPTSCQRAFLRPMVHSPIRNRHVISLKANP